MRVTIYSISKLKGLQIRFSQYSEIVGYKNVSTSGSLIRFNRLLWILKFRNIKSKKYSVRCKLEVFKIIKNQRFCCCLKNRKIVWLSNHEQIQKHLFEKYRILLLVPTFKMITVQFSVCMSYCPVSNGKFLMFLKNSFDRWDSWYCLTLSIQHWPKATLV